MTQSKSSGLVERTFFVVGALFGVASLLNYYEVFAEQGVYAFLEALVSGYRALVHGLFGFLDAPLTALANFFAGLFEFHVDVQPYWKDVFVPIGLYFASSARATHGQARAIYRNALFVFGIVLALFFSVLLASFGADLSVRPAIATLTAGVVLYELLSYALLVLLNAKGPGHPSFGRYLLERPMPSIALGVLLAIAISSLGFADNENTAAFALIAYIFLLGLRGIALAVIFALENRGGWEGTFTQRVLRSRSWILGVLVIVTIAVATAGVAWGGGGS